MAIRQEQLIEGPGARVYRFPAERVRARLERRRAVARRRAALGACVVVVAGMMLANGGGAGAIAEGKSSAPRVVIVKPGQTLWDLARYAPSGIDPRAFVDALVARNHLVGTLQPGMHIRLPK
jgi:hypothetical protein